MSLFSRLYAVISGLKREQESSDWCYYRLQDIELMGNRYFTWARILCADDEGGSAFTARCSGVHFPVLERYAADLVEWHRDPAARDQPQIPIRHHERGMPQFYPHAEDGYGTPTPLQVSQGCLVEMPPELSLHIQNLNKNLRPPSSSAYLRQILRSAKGFG